MITPEQYEAALKQREEAQKLVNEYHKQEAALFKDKWEKHIKGEYFFDDSDLRYSAYARCKCGAGLAYPKDAPINGEWTCVTVLKGENTFEGHQAFPFMTYEIKSEDQPSAHGATTRPKSS